MLCSLKKGNIESFEIIFKMYQPKLIAFSYRYLKVYEDAEGVVQEVFVELWKNRNKINENLSISSYLFSITKNKIIDYFRKKKRQNLFENYLHHYLKNSIVETKESDNKENFRNLNKIVKNLPEKRRIVFLLSKKFGLSRKEIADFMEVSENTVKNHLLEAMKTIKNLLRKENVFILFLCSSFFFM